MTRKNPAREAKNGRDEPVHAQDPDLNTVIEAEVGKYNLQSKTVPV